MEEARQRDLAANLTSPYRLAQRSATGRGESNQRGLKHNPRGLATTGKALSDNDLGHCSSCGRSVAVIERHAPNELRSPFFTSTTYYTYYTLSKLFISWRLTCSSCQGRPSDFVGGIVTSSEKPGDNFAERLFGEDVPLPNFLVRSDAFRLKAKLSQGPRDFRFCALDIPPPANLGQLGCIPREGRPVLGLAEERVEDSKVERGFSTLGAHD